MDNRFNDNSEVKRTYTPEEMGHENFNKTRKKPNKRRIKKAKPNVGVILVIALFAVIFALCIYIIASGKNKAKPSDPDAKFVTDNAEVTTEDPGYINVTVSEEDIYSGDLILVNALHEYKFKSEAPVNISAYKNEYYGLSQWSTQLNKSVIDAFNTLCADYYAENGFKYMQINSAYRSFEDQSQLVTEYTEAYGEDYVKQYVAVPGFSEHHTGLAMDLNVNVEGAIYYVEDYDDCEWFRNNTQNYGFILRYPKDKIYLTGISAESWHYRYVGLPHSKIINDMNFCLEEYIDYIKDYTYDGVILGYNDNTGVYTFTSEDDFTGYAVFYKKADGETTVITVPSKCEYVISGNNVDGYIVTIHK